VRPDERGVASLQGATVGTARFRGGGATAGIGEGRQVQGEVRQRRVEAWRVEPPEHEMEAAQGEGWWGLGRGRRERGWGGEAGGVG